MDKSGQASVIGQDVFKKKQISDSQGSEWQTLMAEATRLYNESSFLDAENMYLQAMDVAKRFGEQDPRLAITLNNLGLIYYTQKMYLKAEPYYREALDIRHRHLGEEHLQVAVTQHNLSLLYYARQEYEKARQAGERSLAIRRKQLDSMHPDIAASMNTLALIWFQLGQLTEALGAAQMACEIRVATLGEEHALTKDSKQNLAEIRNKAIMPGATAVEDYLEVDTSITYQQNRLFRALGFTVREGKTVASRPQHGFRTGKRSWGWGKRIIR